MTSRRVRRKRAAASEFRKWRSNLIANYDFTTGWLKGVNVGGAYRWQDKVILGYKPIYLSGVTPTTNAPAATGVTYDLNSPYYGPSEGNVDLWIGYQRKLSKKISWQIQLNVQNVGKGNSLIPVTVQPDGSVAGWRIAPSQVWTVTNTLTF